MGVDRRARSPTLAQPVNDDTRTLWTQDLVEMHDVIGTLGGQGPGLQAEHLAFAFPQSDSNSQGRMFQRLNSRLVIEDLHARSEASRNFNIRS